MFYVFVEQGAGIAVSILGPLTLSLCCLLVTNRRLVRPKIREHLLSHVVYLQTSGRITKPGLCGAFYLCMWSNDGVNEVKLRHINPWLENIPMPPVVSARALRYLQGPL